VENIQNQYDPKQTFPFSLCGDEERYSCAADGVGGDPEPAHKEADRLAIVSLAKTVNSTLKGGIFWGELCHVEPDASGPEALMAYPASVREVRVVNNLPHGTLC
jgi:hypothetical protein